MIRKKRIRTEYCSHHQGQQNKDKVVPGALSSHTGFLSAWLEGTAEGAHTAVREEQKQSSKATLPTSH